MTIGPPGSRLAPSQSNLLIAAKDALSSGLESIKAGISEAAQKGGSASIKDAVQIMGRGESLSSDAVRNFRTTAMEKFGHANPPHHFFKQLAAQKGVPFGKFQPQELAQKLQDPSLKLHQGLKGLASNIQNSMNSIREQLQRRTADPMDLSQSVLRQSYLESTSDLKMYAEKVKSSNEAKKEIRENLEAAPAKAQQTGPSVSDSIATKDQISQSIQKLEGELSSIGGDAQLANIDLQNIMQKQQQTLQLLSNTAKMLQDTAMAIIRKIGG